MTIVRVPTGTLPTAVREISVVTELRSPAETVGSTIPGPAGVPAAVRNAADSVARSSCPSKPPSSPDSVTATPPASISAAAPETSIVWDPALGPVLPPAKKFVPPPNVAASAVVRKAGVPYWTAVNSPSGVQPGGGLMAEAVGRARAALRAGVGQEVARGHRGGRRGGGEQQEGEGGRGDASVHRPTLSHRPRPG